MSTSLEFEAKLEEKSPLEACKCVKCYLSLCFLQQRKRRGCSNFYPSNVVVVVVDPRISLLLFSLTTHESYRLSTFWPAIQTGVSSSRPETTKGELVKVSKVAQQLKQVARLAANQSARQVVYFAALFLPDRKGQLYFKRETKKRLSFESTTLKNLHND